VKIHTLISHIFYAACTTSSYTDGGDVLAVNGTEVLVDTNERGSVETEERKTQPDDVHTPPAVWVPAVSPAVKREETPEPPAEKIEQVSPPVVAIPQFSSELSFACVLIPRFSDHYLAGDIVDCLREWMKQVCISYGWRLDSISVRPGYLQWVMQVPLNANPAQFMRVIRRFTSERIFEDFPRFKQKNVSGEFWAPGNFVAPAQQLQTPEQVNEFILQTRRNQGIL
jgi:REP element-mobilizing transposase RayT